MDNIRKMTKCFKRNHDTINFDASLETEKDYKERWTSIRIVYFTTFLIALGFTIILTGVWPYLDKLDPNAGKEFMGYVVAANPFAQMIFSPLVGWWSNKLRSIRLPLISTLIIFAFANVIYSTLEIFSSYRKHWMFISRFLVGVSSANMAACRSYISSATTLSERTKAVSMISLAQVLGFIIGPALQTAVVPLGDDGIWIIPNRLKLDMYTAAGWINVLLALSNAILFIPYFFKEHNIAVKEAMKNQGVESEKETYKGKKVDYFSAWTLIISFFVLVFNFMLLETLGTSLTMDQFAWTKQEALYYMGILMSVGAFVAIFTFVSINPLCKKFPEVKVLIWGGFFFMVLGRAVYIPIGQHTPQIFNETERLIYLENVAQCKNNTSIDSVENINDTISTHEIHNSLLVNCSNIIEYVGCPSTQEWCNYTPVLTLTQFLLGYFLTVLGYPIGVTLIQTIFSKLLGSRPQGVWMGFMTGSGCLSRVLGPVFVTYIYSEFGTRWTFGMTTIMMVLSMAWLLWFEKRLVTNDQMKPNVEELLEIKNFTDDLKNEDS